MITTSLTDELVSVISNEYMHCDDALVRAIDRILEAHGSAAAKAMLLGVIHNARLELAKLQHLTERS